MLGIGMLLLSPRILNAELPRNISWNMLASNEGLSQNSVSDIARDELGRMWFATQDGLNRYDGDTVNVYYGPPADGHTAISSSDIRTLESDLDGLMYAGLSDGTVVVFETATGRFRELVNLHPLTVTRIDRLPFGQMGIVADGRLFVTDGKEVREFDSPNDEAITSMRNLGPAYPDSAAAVFSSGRIVLMKFDGPWNFSWDVIAFTGVENVRCLVAAGEDVLTIDPLGRISRLRDGKTVADLDIPAGISPTCILYTADGNIWVATDGAGLYVVDPAAGDVLHLTTQDGLPDDTILTSYQDPSDTIWLGTWSAGVSYYHAGIRVFDHWTPGELGISSPDVMAVTALTDGRLAMGTLGGGVYVYRNSTDLEMVANLNTGSGYPSDNILALHQDHDGRLWVGTAAQGAFVVDTGDWNVIRRFDTGQTGPGRISGNRVQSLGGLDDGRIALGIRRTDDGEGSLTLIDEESLEVDSSIPFDVVWTIGPERDGRLLIGTDIGLVEWDTGAGDYTILHPPQSGRSDPRVWSIETYGEDSLLLGTIYGLVRLERDGTVRRWTTRDGLPNNVVYAVIADSSGRIWVSTNKGIAVLDPESDTILGYTIRHGLQSQEFNLNSACRIDNGHFLFGGINGVNSFNPSEVSSGGYEIDYYIRDFRIFNHQIEPGTEWRGRTILNQSIETTDRIVLEHDEDAISFQIGVSDYISPAEVRIRYRLLGLEDEWNDAGNRRYTSYTNLTPGSYRFQYQAVQAGMPWPEPVHMLIIDVEPPFVQTLPFYLLMSAAIAVASFGVFSYYLRLRREIQYRTVAQNRYIELNERLEQKVADRTASLREAMQELELAQDHLVQSEKLAAVGPLIAGIAHEINTPVGIAVTGSSWIREKIHLLTGDQQTLCGDLDDAIAYLKPMEETADLIEKNLKRTSDLIEKLRSATLIPAGTDVVDTVFPECIREIADTFRIQVRGDDIRFEINSDNTFRFPVSHGTLWRILSLLFQNSIQHGFPPVESGRRRGKISISSTIDNGDLIVVYADDGSGMAKETLEHAVEPFFTTNRSGGSTGLGLFVVNTLVLKNLSGELTIESERGKGFRLTMKIPRAPVDL